MIGGPNVITGEKYWKDKFDLSDHVPDMSLKKFLLSLDGEFCIFFSLEAGKLKLISRKSKLNSPIEDWTKLSEPAYSQTFNTSNGYEMDYDRQGDKTYPPALDKITIGKGEEKYQFPWFTFEDEKNTPFEDEDRSWLTPISEEEGTSTMFKINNPFTMRLLFYRGMQLDSEGYNYPLATHGSQNYSGDEIGNYSLAIQGDKGIHKIWWKDYIQLITEGKEIEKILRLDIQTILKEKQFKNPRKKNIPCSGRNGGCDKIYSGKSFYGWDFFGEGEIYIAVIST